MNKIFAPFLAFLLAFALLTGTASGAVAAGNSPQNPVVVASVSDVPAGAVEDNPSTYNTAAKCDTTRSWVLTVPGNTEVNHDEFKFYRDVPAVPQSHEEWTVSERTRTETVEYRYSRAVRTLVPAVEEVSHQEYKYKKVIPATDEVSHKVYSYKQTVKDFKVEYQWEKHVKGNKFTRDSRGNFTVPAGPFDYIDYPSAGPVWADGGEGGHGDTFVIGNVQYRTTYFKYFKTGVTREIPNGSHDEFSGEVTEPRSAPWVLLPGYPKTVVDSEATPEQTFYYNDGNWTTDVVGEPWVKIDERKVVDVTAVPAYYTDWVYDGTTEWTTDSTVPANTDTVQYYRQETQLVYGEWSEWTVLNVVTEEPAQPVNTTTHEYKVEGPVTVNDEAIPGYREYLAENNTTSRDIKDAAWVRSAPEDDSWFMFDKRNVVDSEATPEVTTYYAWTDGEKCETPEPPVTPQPPVDKPEPPVLTGSPVLPNTGGTEVGLLIVGGLLVAAGAVVLVRRRKTL